MVVLIHITATPPGDAPEEARQAWVGLELPLAAGAKGPWLDPAGDCGGLRAAPRGFWISCWEALRRRWVWAYLVHTRTALEILAAKDPEAVRWWRECAHPSVWKPGRKFIFPRACAVLVPQATPAAPLANPLHQELLGHLAFLMFLVWVSALVIVAGVTFAVLAFRPQELPMGLDPFYGFLGIGLGLMYGGARNLVATWNGYREVKGARGLLHQYRASFLGGVQADLDDADTLQPYATLVVMLLPGGAWFFLRYRVSEFVGYALLAIACFSLLLGGFMLTGWAMDRWGGREERDAPPDRGDALAPGLAPRVLMLIGGAVAGTLMMLLGAGRMAYETFKTPQSSGAFLGGVTVALGGFLGGGSGLLVTSHLRQVLAGLLPPLDRLRRWQWRGWKTVMEDPQWNWFDMLAVIWVGSGAAAGVMTLLLWRTFPWIEAYGVHNVVLAFCLKGCLFVWVRHVIRDRRRKEPDTKQ
jgi:hypothetical protein